MSLRTITRENNELYLKRWALRSQTPENQDAGGRVFLHRFFTHDDDGHHCHPWRWSFSIVLWGSYEEELLEIDPYAPTLPAVQISSSMWVTEFGRSIRKRTVRWFNFIPSSRYHRIAKLNGKVWTLFFTGPSLPSWGFWMPGRGHVEWKTRLRERGIDV